MRKPGYSVALLLLLLGGLGSACSSDPAERPVRQLGQQRPALEKRVALREQQPETKQLAQPDWAKELQLFYQADINKPALRGAYAVQTTDSAGLTRRTFRRLPDVEHQVVELSVLQAGPVVRELHATLSQDNPLFFSGKAFRLRFGADGVLSSYEVQGRQKLVAFDTTRYSASARVLR
jgi:hypothetical protein